jgi:hypothetical protein
LEFEPGKKCKSATYLGTARKILGSRIPPRRQRSYDLRLSRPRPSNYSN